MSTAPTRSAPVTLPDHTQLPDKDGTFVKNFQEHPQSILLTDSIEPILARRYPDGRVLHRPGLRDLLEADRSSRTGQRSAPIGSSCPTSLRRSKAGSDDRT